MKLGNEAMEQAPPDNGIHISLLYTFQHEVTIYDLKEEKRKKNEDLIILLLLFYENKSVLFRIEIEHQIVL